LSQVLSVDKDHIDDGKHGDHCDFGRLFFMKGPKEESAISDETVDVSHMERAVLEFYIAKIRICSQRKLKYWAMVPPLGSHSCGHNSRNPNSHPLHGAGCLATPLWTTLNEINETTIPAHADLISNQPTISMVFDDWQMNIKTIWQTCGSSSNYLGGVPSFIKKDKAICLLVGLVLCSPSGISFWVVSCTFENLYSVKVHGDLIAGVNENDNADNVLVQNEISQVTSGLLLWPAVDWEVMPFPGVGNPVTRLQDLSYIDLVIHPSVNAWVNKDVLRDQLLFSHQQFYDAGTPNTHSISLLEYNKLICDSNDLLLLNTFARYLTSLHQVQEELHVEDKEENEEHNDCNNNYNPSLCLPDSIPHQYESKKLYLENIEWYTKEFYHVPRFYTGLIHRLYPHSEVEEKYIHAPLIGRDETSNKGMMLTNAALLKLAGLVMKQTNGKFILGPNATK
jgi:hypothetical protein